CLGSALALGLALTRVGVPARVGSADGVPEPFRALPGASAVVTTPPPGPWDAAVAVECSSPDRAGAFAEVLARARVVVNVDHHLTNTGYGHLVYLDPSAAAVGEMVAEIIRALGVPLDREIAQALLTAVVTDTGAFRYPNTSPQTLRLAAELMEAGGSVAEIVERVYETRTAAGLRLLGLALASLRVSPDGRVAWTTVTPAMLAQAGAAPEDTTGIVGVLRQIRGVKVALLFEQTPDGVRVGIRSRDGVRSHVIAEAFGGGGHPGAAGFTAAGRLEEVVAATLAEVERELRRDGADVPAGPASAPAREAEQTG
ncbi:MAG: DHHA1 domain-containing protein, partial [Armatimonadota bacterium]|nr:DHHA1 domain-containing protein [Armatimonadota bacterium]